MRCSRGLGISISRSRRRRTVRDFSPDPIPDGVIEDCLLAAGTGTEWGQSAAMAFFCCLGIRGIKREKSVRRREEEGEGVLRWTCSRMTGSTWLGHLGTDAEKPFLETAPALIAIFQKSKTLNHGGVETQNILPRRNRWVSLRGFLIAALHHVGLASLTHTPSPMRFLNEILNRPATEKPFLLLVVVGYPAAWL